MSTVPLRGRFVWHELMTSDPTAGMSFYRKLTGWKSEPYADVPDYTMLVGPRGPVGGCMALPHEAGGAGVPPNWLSYIGTPDTDATARQAESLGGKVLRGPTSIPVGRFAIISDPQGVVFALYTPNLMDDSDPKAEVGEFSWHELATSNLDAGWSFYEKLFGWEKTRAMEMPDIGTYILYGLRGLELGGMYKLPPGFPAPPHWLPYIRIADVKKGVSTAQKLGAKFMVPPTEVPGGDWIAVGADPQGAQFAIHSSAAKPAARPAPKKKAAAKKPARAAAKKAAKPARKAAPRKKMAMKPKKKVVAKKKAAPKKKGTPSRKVGRGKK
jgi:hypothetical protein